MPSFTQLSLAQNLKYGTFNIFGKKKNFFLKLTNNVPLAITHVITIVLYLSRVWTLKVRQKIEGGGKAMLLNCWPIILYDIKERKNLKNK